jgi:hypothetical protein
MAGPRTRPSHGEGGVGVQGGAWRAAGAAAEAAVGTSEAVTQGRCGSGDAPGDSHLGHLPSV